MPPPSPHSQPPTGEVDPQVPLTHVMLARDDTAPLLARALLRAWLRSRAYAVEAGLIVLTAVVLVLGFHQWYAGIILAGMLVLMPVLLAVRARSVARSLAPAGFTLGLGLGQNHLAVRHAVATVVSPYAAWASVAEGRGVVRLVTRKGALLVVPAELVGPDLEQLRAHIGSAPGASVADPAAHAAADTRATREPEEQPELPLAYTCTRATRGQLTRAAVLVRLRRWPTLLVLLGTLMVIGLAVASPRTTSWTTAALALLIVAGLLAADVGVVWRSLGSGLKPGQVVRAAVRADALVVRDATATATMAFQAIDRIVVTRHAVVLRSPTASLLVLPRPLLPETDLARMRGAAGYFRARR